MMTFDEAIPSLKGFYLTLNSWRVQRDEDDWKMSDKRWKEVAAEVEAVSEGQVDNGPETVVASKQKNRE